MAGDELVGSRLSSIRSDVTVCNDLIVPKVEDDEDPFISFPMTSFNSFDLRSVSVIVTSLPHTRFSLSLKVYFSQCFAVKITTTGLQSMTGTGCGHLINTSNSSISLLQLPLVRRCRACCLTITTSASRYQLCHLLDRTCIHLSKVALVYSPTYFVVNLFNLHRNFLVLVRFARTLIDWFDDPWQMSGCFLYMYAWGYFPDECQWRVAMFNAESSHFHGAIAMRDTSMALATDAGSNPLLTLPSPLENNSLLVQGYCCLFYNKKCVYIMLMHIHFVCLITD